MKRVTLALQPGGCGRAVRSRALLEGLGLWPPVRILCGAGDAAMLAPSLPEGLRPVVATDLGEWHRTLSSLAADGADLCVLDADLDAVGDESLPGPAVLTTDRARLPGEADEDRPPPARRWKSAVERFRGRLWWGEVAQLKSPERRVQLREDFFEVGLVSGLVDPEATAGSAEPPSATHADEDAPPPRLLHVPGGHACDGEVEPGARARGWQVEVQDPRAPRPGLCGRLSGYDAVVVPGGLGLLGECSGLALPTLCLPGPDERQRRRARYFAGRLGILTPTDAGDFVRSLAALLDGERPEAVVPRPTAERQRQNLATAVRAVRAMLEGHPPGKIPREASAGT